MAGGFFYCQKNILVELLNFDAGLQSIGVIHNLAYVL